MFTFQNVQMACVKPATEKIVNAYLSGVKVEALAREHFLSDRHIWRILKETNMQDDRQESLFLILNNVKTLIK